MFLVTGASSGIGKATVAELLDRGVSVLAVARNIEAIQKLDQPYSGKLHVVSADLSSELGLTKVVEAASEHSPLQGIVHAAGSPVELMAYQNLSTDDVAYHFNVHVLAPITLNQRLQLGDHQCRIVYIDSFSATALRVGWSAYSIVKAAAQMAARAAVAELRLAKVIRIFPGAVRTALVETVLGAKEESPTSEVFKALDADGSMVDPSDSGKFIADVLLDATDEQLAAREFWDFTNTDDHLH